MKYRDPYIHTHPCQHCKTPVCCQGDLERNHDGWPEVICREYHLASGVVDFVLCESCTQAQSLEKVHVVN